MIKLVFTKISAYLHPSSKKNKVSYHELAPTMDKKLSHFLPILHLTNNQKLYLHQEEHFGDIHLALDKKHLPEMRDDLDNLEKEEFPEDKVEMFDDILEENKPLIEDKDILDDLDLDDEDGDIEGDDAGDNMNGDEGDNNESFKKEKDILDDLEDTLT
jgi:hypothetical protein